MAFLDKAGLEYFWQQTLVKLGNKVDKEEGKSLSTEDFTTEEKMKLANIKDSESTFIVNVMINSADGVNYTITSDATYNEILIKYNEDYVVIMAIYAEGRIYTGIINFDPDKGIYVAFSMPPECIGFISVDSNNNWNFNFDNYILKDNMINEINEYTSGTEVYPSTLAVVNYVNSKLGTAGGGLQFWKPNTDYAVGDIVLGLTPSDTYDIIVCKTAHTSSSGDYYQGSDNDKWEVRPFHTAYTTSFATSANSAAYDSFGNYFPSYYLSQEAANNLYLKSEDAASTYAKMATINVTYYEGAVMMVGLPTFDELMALLPAATTENKRILYVNLQYVDENSQQKFATGHMAFDQQNWWFVSELIGDGKLYTLTVKEGNVWDVTVSELGGSGNITVDDTLTEGSENPISSGAVYEAIYGSWEVPV